MSLRRSLSRSCGLILTVRISQVGNIRSYLQTLTVWNVKITIDIDPRKHLNRALPRPDIRFKNPELLNATPQTKHVNLSETYSCGVLQIVPKTQLKTVILQPGEEFTVADSFCLDPEGEYEIRISGVDLTEPIKINEVGDFISFSLLH